MWAQTLSYCAVDFMMLPFSEFEPAPLQHREFKTLTLFFASAPHLLSHDRPRIRFLPPEPIVPWPTHAFFIEPF